MGYHKNLAIAQDEDRNNPDTSQESERVQEMVSWFLSRFEDPVENCPYDSAEGGYQYLWGGPIYDERGELEEVFPSALDEDLDRATELLQACDAAGVWASRSPDLPEDEEPDAQEPDE